MILQIAFWLAWVAAAIANSFTDWHGFGYSSTDWLNKYKKPTEMAPDTWYYRITGVPYKEKFPLSTNILVFLTDKFHFWQAVQTTLLITSMVIAYYAPPPIHWYFFPLTLVVSWGVVTHVSYILIVHHDRRKANKAT